MNGADLERGEHVIVGGPTELKSEAIAIHGDGGRRGEGRDGLQRHHGLVGIRPQTHGIRRAEPDDGAGSCRWDSEDPKSCW